MKSLQFAKYEGLGNDFIVVDAPSVDEVSAEVATRLCDRRRGIGADGVLLVVPPVDGRCDARMRVINADGSVPEMCGNGLRCVVSHWAFHHPGTSALRIETDAGPRDCTIERGEPEDWVTIDMGRVVHVEDRTIEAAGRAVVWSVADAGNPHAVTFDPTLDASFDLLGPAIATHAAFPSGINVEFARVTPAGIELRVWERGVGPTLACGTGACATVAVACAKGLASWDTPTNVHLPGGTLGITMDRQTRHATMRGPARRVFSGTVTV